MLPLRILFLFFISISCIYGISIENRKYFLTIGSGGEIEITAKESNKTFLFKACFAVARTLEDPGLALRSAQLDVAYNVPTWEITPESSEVEVFEEKERQVDHHGDGFDDRILSAKRKGQRTANLYDAGDFKELAASRVRLVGEVVFFEFPDQPDFELHARLELPDSGYPLLEYSLHPKVKAYYSVVFTGAPKHQISQVEEIWQPLIWTEKRFPDNSYLTMAFRCPLPTAFTQISGHTLGVLADPTEYPFQPLPLFDNSRFGVSVRNKNGDAQPLFIAPVLGGHGSLLDPDEIFKFKLQLISEPHPITKSYEIVSRDVYGFKDYRDNATGSINSIIERIIDYGMSEFANFNAELKGCSYSTDVPGAVKNVSSLNPLNMALIFDDERIFEKRAYPTIEYLLSREKFLFTLDAKEKIQSPSRRLAGPASPLSELTSLYEITNKSNPVYLELAKELYGKNRILNLDLLKKGDRWQNSLALYQATGDRDYLERACIHADTYLEEFSEKPQENFTNNPFFWTECVPDFSRLVELYEATQKVIYLDAAHQSARRFCLYIWMSPAIPDQPILINQNNQAPVYWYLKKKSNVPMQAKESWMKPWRLSAMGLTCESTGTSNGHRAIFMANYAPWLLRISHYTNDAYLAAVARSAVVGRYRNFPGYHINTARTNIYERDDYPLRPHNEINVNSFHYNHIWPNVSLLIDFLVTETWKRSGEKINFPSAYIEGYAYLQNKFYGHKSGLFYDYDDAVLWMPRGLFHSTSGQINGLSARGDGRAYFAFTNQAQIYLETTLQFNRNLLSASEGPLEAEIRINNGKTYRKRLADDELTINFPPAGIIAITLHNVEPKPAFQESILGLKEADMWVEDYLAEKFGGLRAMVLNWGKEKTRAFIYLQADDSKFQSVSLLRDKKIIMTDDKYPYEFTIPVGEKSKTFNFSLTGIDSEGKKVESKSFSFSR